VLLYGLIAIGLLSPMASNTVLPAGFSDHFNHVRIIIQARMAIEEGQFPIRVAPYQDDGCRFPLYKFYSPLVYTAAGAMYKWLIPWNPFLVYKVMYWLALVLGGAFTWRTVRWLTHSTPIAVITGALYMASPYFLVNIHARAAFTEAMGQGVIPAVVYFSLRCYTAGRRRWFLAAAVGWFALSTTHLISFLYSSLFVGLLLLGLALLAGRIRNPALRLIRIGGA
jgi:uncharacterized membrane protein